MHQSFLAVGAFAATLALPITAAHAQTTFTSPLGLDTREGNAAFFHFAGNRRLQVIDNTIETARANLRAIAFRRDGLSTVATGVARQIEIVVNLGVGDWARLANNFEANYLPSTKTEVFARRFVSFPDWSAVPRVTPAPFDFAIPFDTLWSFPGNAPLIWDLLSEKPDPNGVAPLDRYFIDQENGLTGIPIGLGCTATGGTQAFTHTASLINRFGVGSMTLRVAATNGPANAPVLLYLAGRDSNLTVPGLCSTLHALPDVLLGVGTTTATGEFPRLDLELGYNRALEGFTVYTQISANDLGQPGIPLAMTNGVATTMPSEIEVAYHWAQVPTPFGTLFVGGAPIAQFTY